MTQYRIPEANIEKLRKKAETIRKKASKYGCDFTFEEVGEEYEESVLETGEKVTHHYIIVEAEGKAVINGWQFVAEIEHTEKGNIISGVGGINVPKMYYNRKPICDHCKSDRMRKDTYIVRNESGEFKQVGKTCLRDYTGGMSVEYASALAQFVRDAEEAQTSGGWWKVYYNVDEWLRLSAETILHFGYVRNPDRYSDDYSETETRPTSNRVFDYWEMRNGKVKMYSDRWFKLKDEMESVNFDENSEPAKKLVAEAKAWIMEHDDTGNYIHNLQVAVSLSHDSGRNLGLLTSLFPTYRKDLERKEAKRKKAEAEKASEYVGKVGDRITVELAEAKALTSWITQWGETILWKLTDTSGNVYVWKTGNDIPDGTEKIKGTIKEHSEWNGVKQTILTRCKLM